MILSAIPVLGFLLYILVGQNFRKKRKFSKKYQLADETYKSLATAVDNWYVPKQWLEIKQPLLYKLAHRLTYSPISFNTHTKILTDGESTFREIIQELQNAKHTIHLEYYIVRDDELGRKIADILIEKARQGLTVRFLYDAVGSFQLSDEYVCNLKNAGVSVYAFSPVRFPILNDKVNYRNHRKIIVVDDSIGFMGGLNIGDEYLGKNEYFGYWRDTHLKLVGEAVSMLQAIFIQDWFFVTGISIPLQFEDIAPPALDEKLGGVQLIAGGPDTKWEVIKNLYFAMIVGAKKSIWIASPYFIPDEDIVSALKVAALSGIDVRILQPAKPDKYVVFYASRSFFPDLLDAGVKIYQYNKGFLHSKIVIVDGKVASIGTANMDMRSFHLNFEVNAFLYDTASIESLTDDFLNDIFESDKIDKSEFKRRHWKYRFYESLCRLLSPLL